MPKGLIRLANFASAMDTTDWKDALGKAFNMPVPEAGDNTPDEGEQTANDKGDALQQQGARRLSIVLERKGRGGKQATIVTGFVADDEAVKQVASQLKRKLGVGGSARGGEILIQGDFRQRVAEELRALGFKC
ncbi:MAG: translation initiation factor [Bacteroidales bacterium]|nr:translation initiation factor [Bacteroidales bacterium]